MCRKIYFVWDFYLHKFENIVKNIMRHLFLLPPSYLLFVSITYEPEKKSCYLVRHCTSIEVSWCYETKTICFCMDISLDLGATTASASLSLPLRRGWHQLPVVTINSVPVLDVANLTAVQSKEDEWSSSPPVWLCVVTHGDGGDGDGLVWTVPEEQLLCTSETQ